MEDVRTSHFDQLDLGDTDGVATLSVTVNATRTFSVVRAPEDWYPHMMGRCLKFEGSETDYQFVTITLHGSATAVNFAVHDLEGGIFRGDIGFFDVADERIGTVKVDAGGLRVVAFEHQAYIDKIRFLSIGPVYLDNIEVIQGPHSSLPEREASEPVFEYFDDVPYGSHVPELKTPRLRIHSEQLLEVVGASDGAFPNVIGHYVIVTGSLFKPQPISIFLEAPASSVRFMLKEVGDAIKGPIEFHDSNGVRLGATDFLPGPYRIVTFASDKGIREVRFAATDNVVLDSFEFVPA